MNNFLMANAKVCAQYLLFIKDREKSRKIDRLISEFYPKAPNKHRIKYDVVHAHFLYAISFEDYFYYDFIQKSPHARKEYVTHDESNHIYDRISQNNAAELFKNKYKAYETFKDYYGREVAQITDKKDWPLFVDFCRKHKEIIVKPIAEGLGNGIFKADTKENPEALFEKVLKVSPAVIEEVVEQTGIMAAFHPSSVNTVRYATYINNGIVNGIYATLRMGDGGRVVDNASAGGIAADIDLSTGIVCSLGYRKDGRSYLCHPDTGTQIIGASIPDWKQLTALGETLAKIVPERKVVGWDFAYTENGWIMIEGNNHPGHEGVQITKHGGIRPILKKLGII